MQDFGEAAQSWLSTRLRGGPFHVNLCLIVWILKEDNSCVFTADEQLGAANKKYLIVLRSLSTFVHKGIRQYCILSFQLIAGSPSTVKDGNQTDVNLQHQFFVGLDNLKR